MSNYPPPPPGGGGTPPPPPPPGGGATPPPPAPPPPGGYGYGQQPPAAPAGNQKALWSLITGILGLLCCCWPVGIVALILGFTARKEIDASGGVQTGSGMALAGIILGVLAIVAAIILTILYFANVLTFNFDASTTGS